MTETRVDVIIPCYNQGHFLAETLDSVLAQTYPHVGAIVVDDGSTDSTPQVAARYGERIRYLRQENAGLSAARNAGLLDARAEFVLFLDSDDALWPDMIARLMEAARGVPTAAVFHGSWQTVDPAGRVISAVEKESLGTDAFHDLLTGNRFPCHALVVRRAAFAEAGLFDTALRSCEDWDMWLRLAARGANFVAVPEAVAIYRHTPGSMSKNRDRMWQTGRAVLRKSQTYHGHCDLCRRASRRGIARLRERYFEFLIGDLYARKAQAGIGASLAKGLREVARDPGLAGLLVREVAPYLRGAHRPGAGKAPPQQRCRLGEGEAPAEPVAEIQHALGIPDSGSAGASPSQETTPLGRGRELR